MTFIFSSQDNYVARYVFIFFFICDHEVLAEQEEQAACLFLCSLCHYCLHFSSAALSSAVCKGGSHFFTVHLCLQYVPNILLS